MAVCEVCGNDYEAAFDVLETDQGIRTDFGVFQEAHDLSFQAAASLTSG